MKQSISTLKKLVVQIGMLLMVAGCAVQPVIVSEPAEGQVITPSAGHEIAVTPSAATVAANPNEPGCAHPSAENLAQCREMEAAILSVTVRLEFKIYASSQNGEMHLEDSSIGHATILEGRYLLTHNHFGLSLADFADGLKRTVSLYRPDGELILMDAPFGAFEVVAAAPQTLVFDFGAYGGLGLFGSLGMNSADTHPQLAAQLRPGMEVAQIDWDGRMAHVDWVRVLEVQEFEGTLAVVLDNFVQQGASGGGVFFEGSHIGNNWSRSTEVSASGGVLNQYTTVALNVGAGQVGG